MQFSQVNFSFLPYDGINPPVTKPDPKFLEELGEERIRDLLDRFYTLLYQSPIKHLFPQTEEEMKTAAQNSADFFIQICGGPKYFNKNRGAPQMSRRHAPFAITPEVRLHWLVLFEEALQPLIGQVSNDSLQSFWDYINVFSLWMVNTRS
ncbi:MAG: globin [Sulfurovum sp.]|nr:globin [Sulfurovum sp.]